LTLQTENDKLRDRVMASGKTDHLSGCIPARQVRSEQDFDVKNHHISMLTAKCETLEVALSEKERRIIELEQRLKHTEGSHIRDEKNSAEANMAIKALEDALRRRF